VDRNAERALAHLQPLCHLARHGVDDDELLALGRGDVRVLAVARDRDPGGLAADLDGLGHAEGRELHDRQRVVRLVGDEGFSDRRRISRVRAAPCGERRSKCNRGRQYSDAHGAEPSRPLRAFA
jgi:hypothetical protein